MAHSGQSGLKGALRAPEGKWALGSERRATANFAPDLSVHLSYASLHEEGEEGGADASAADFLVLNCQQFLHICFPQALDREPLRSVDFRHLSTGGPAYPTCHAYTPGSRDEFDLAVGLSTGEVVLLSLRAQLRAHASNTRPVSSLSFNPDGCANASRCVSLAWLPGAEGTALLAAHRDGAVLLYHKVSGSSSEPKLLARSSSQQGMRPPATQLQGPGGGGGVNAAAASPDGRHVAVACRDGVLRVYACPAGGLVAGFKSYYGGLQCCCWSPDGRYVAAGGEDDLIAIYSLAERCVIAYCQGHSSWVSGLAFDPWACHTEPRFAAAAAAAAEGQQQGGGAALGGEGDRVYRLASVGQDCQLALWDIVVSDEAVAAAQLASANNSPERERPGLPLPSKRRGRSISPSKRHGHGSSSGGSGVFRSRSSASSVSAATSAADPGALPAALATGIVSPPLPRADWPLVTPVALGRVHPEPCSAVMLTPAALFTACHGACVRRWARPAPGQALAPAGAAAAAARQESDDSREQSRHSSDR